MRDQFLLDPDVIFLNHGSFGACPKPVFETYQRWQLELERQPVAFLGRQSDALLDEARRVLGEYLNADAADLIFVPNATAGVNMVARSLRFAPGDEILTTDHEYGACDLTWRFVCERSGACYIQRAIPLPVESPEALVDAFWQGVTARTRVIYLSHITSPTALLLPVEQICQRAREAGILTVIDGAHAPGQVDVDLRAIGADFYTGNCHKWLCAPKGSGFLYTPPNHQRMLEPLLVSWGWSEDGGTFASRNQWQGTRDIAAFLSVPAAIAFQAAHRWDAIRARCHALASATRARIAELTGCSPICPDSPVWYRQMFTARLPACDPAALQQHLYDVYRVEVPVVIWRDHPYIRVSFQAYNTESDADGLLAALGALLR